MEQSRKRAEKLGVERSDTRRIDVCSLQMTALSFEAAIRLITRWAMTAERGRVICAANVHMVVEAEDDPEFASKLQHADVVLPDGMPLVWMMRTRGVPTQERIAGMDLLPALCAAAEREGISIYFVGSTPAVLDAIRSKVTREHPRLQIGGMESPPFRPLSDVEDAALVSRIRLSGAGLVLIALGCPKQERWMIEHRDRIGAVMIGLGAAFPVYAGFQPRAPRGMQRLGLEWLHRLVNEPRRLWRRYLYTNTRFLWCLMQERSARYARGGAMQLPGISTLSPPDAALD